MTAAPALPMNSQLDVVEQLLAIRSYGTEILARVEERFDTSTIDSLS